MKKAYTLTELIIVVAIILVLGSLIRTVYIQRELGLSFEEMVVPEYQSLHLQKETLKELRRANDLKEQENDN